jgi:hypothetical protein
MADFVRLRWIGSLVVGSVRRPEAGHRNSGTTHEPPRYLTRDQIFFAKSRVCFPFLTNLPVATPERSDFA